MIFALYDIHVNDDNEGLKVDQAVNLKGEKNR